MSIVLDGTKGLTFPSGNTQSDSALVTTGGTLAGPLTINGNLNFAPGTSGIVFNNSSASVNSTMNDYETGTWTPTDVSGAGLNINPGSSYYTKIGNMVFCSTVLNYPSTTNSSTAAFSLPFSVLNSNNALYGGYIIYTNLGSIPTIFSNGGSASASFYAGTTSALLNSTVSAKQLRVVVIYQATF
jgi:hypothetical protein